MRHHSLYPSVLKSRFSKKLVGFLLCFIAFILFVVFFPQLTFLRGQAVISHDFAIFLWSFLSIILAGCLALYFYFQIVRPIAHLESRLLTLYSSIHGDSSAFPSQISLDSMLDAVIDYQQSFADQELTFKYLRAEAEFNALQSQINPHFLFNTLESIRGYVQKNGVGEIAKITEAISNLFRSSIQKASTLCTLADEIENVRNYMLIQEFRFPGKFKFEINLSDEPGILNCQLPTLTIQPLVENAIFHGLELIPTNGRICLDVYSTPHRLIIRVSDNGCGISKERLAELNQRLNSDEIFSSDTLASSSGTGIGLINIHQRIRLQFGSQYGLTIASTLHVGTEIEMTLPLVYHS